MAPSANRGDGSATLERRGSSYAARGPRTGDRPSRGISVGTRVVLEDLDDGSREEFVLVSSGESNPAEGWLSNESPVGRAIAGRHEGDLVDVRAPRVVRHMRIAAVRVRATGCGARRPRAAGGPLPRQR